jgi:hypothetical protein
MGELDDRKRREELGNKIAVVLVFIGVLIFTYIWYTHNASPTAM